MSDKGYDSTNISGGVGRGKLMKCLMGLALSQRSSEPDQASIQSAEGSTGKNDSGIITQKSDSLPTRGIGRGKLFEIFSTPECTKTSSTPLSTSDKVSNEDAVFRRANFFSALTPTELEAGLQLQATHLLPSRMQRLQIAANQTIATDDTAKSLESEKSTELKVPADDIVAPEPEDCKRLGISGRKSGALSNYIRLKIEANKGVFEYEVRFEPNVHAERTRYHLLNQLRSALGNTLSFDGVVLYLPIVLPDKVTKLESTNKNDGSTVTVSIIYKRQKKLADCVHLFAVLFSRIMRSLEFIRFGRKNFDPSAPKIVPQHKLEVWPGYITAVDEYEDGVMLCVDVTHRVLCQTTVLEKMTEAYYSSRGNNDDFRKTIQTALIGSVILTRYNNKTYRIDDIDFDANPLKTFHTKDREVSYVEYYRSQYNIEIKDLKQPLLISRKEVRISGKDEPQLLVFCIVPEICYLTGLTDEMRADYKVMRDIATYTRISPNQRVEALSQYCSRVNSTVETREILSNWGLSLEENPVKLEIRQLEEENIFFAKNKSFSAGRNADFGKYATTNELLDVIHLTNWLVIHTRNDGRAAKAFIDCMERNSRPMGIMVTSPRVIVLNDDKTDTYIQTLRKSLKAETQIVVAICPTSRDDRYAAIKKVCCAELPIPSQVINSRTLSNDVKNRSIVQKIALQMNCKMGGTLWTIKIPFDNVMICGIDTYHEAKSKSSSVSAFVASLNNSFTRWYSKAVIQTKNEEFVHGLVVSFQKSLEAYQQMNNKLPNRIIIYRDGVGDGQLKLCTDYELPQLKDACKFISDSYQPDFTFIVVQKRINTRIFANDGNDFKNPDPGCILDNTITRRHLYDFFLIPQSVRQGTVTPTHMVVAHDMANFSPDILQRLSYKLCFLYYNWPGTVRVPACCQYAHKLAYLVGQSIKRETAEKLADKLFYL